MPIATSVTDYYKQLDAIRQAGYEHAKECHANGLAYPEQNLFSGEWADDLTGQDALDWAGIHTHFDRLQDFEQTDVYDAFEDGYYSFEWGV